MIEILVINSGWLAAISAWTLVVLPSRLANLDYKSDPISRTAELSRLGKIFNLGLLLSGIFQAIFVLMLTWKFFFVSVPIGILLFLIGATSCSFLAFVRIDKRNSVHTVLAQFYFALCPIGAVIFGFQLIHAIGSTALIGILLATANFVGALFLYLIVHNKSYAEYWGILTSTIWVLHFYFVSPVG